MPTNPLEPLTSARLADRAHQTLLDAIMTGELRAGQQLRDRKWSERLNVSRMPVREAFQYLQWQGLTDVQAARYTKLMSFTADSAREEARGWAAVHASLAESLCSGDDDVLLKHLRRAQTRHREGKAEPTRTAANFEFFRALRDTSRHFSVRLSGTAVSYRLKLASTMLPDHRDADAELHAAIIQAITGRDATAFREAFARWADHITHDGHDDTGAAA